MISPHFSDKEARDAVKWMYGFTDAQTSAYIHAVMPSTIEEIVKCYHNQLYKMFEED